MVIVKVQRTRNVVGAIKYLLNTKSHDGIHDRVGALSAQHYVPSIADLQSMATLHDFRKTKAVHAALMIQSFSNDELNPDSQDDIELANKIGYETAVRVYGKRRRILVVTQADNGNVHNHVVALSPDIDTGKSLRGKVYNHSYVADISDSVVAENNVRNVILERKSEYTNRESMGEIKRREKGEYVFKDDIKQRIEQCLNNIDITTWDKCLKSMKDDYGVDIRKGKKTISYKFTGLDDKEHIIRGSRLGSLYDIKGVEYAITDNAEKYNIEQQQQQQQQIRQLGDFEFEGTDFEFEQSHTSDSDVAAQDSGTDRLSEQVAAQDSGTDKLSEQVATTNNQFAKLTEQVRLRQQQRELEEDRKRRDRTRERLNRASERLGEFEGDTASERNDDYER